MAQKKGKKNIPLRTCMATKVKKPKNELVRFVLNPETNRVEIDLKSKIRARGASLDISEEAFDIMMQKKALPRALKLDKDLSKEEYQKLKVEFLRAIEDKHFRPANKPVRVRIDKKGKVDLVQNSV